MLNIILIFSAYFFLPSILSYNLNTKFPTIFNGTRGSYFGYSVALHRNKNGAIALIGAPRSNSTVLRKEIYQPGALYKCDLKKFCEEVDLNKKDESGDWRNRINFGIKDTMWLGVSLDTSIKNEIITCAHLWKNEYFYANGICYAINSNLNSSSVSKLTPFADLTRQTTSSSVSLNALAQVGTSIAFSEDGNALYLGAPGFYNWAGTFVRYDLNTRHKYRSFYPSDPPEARGPVSYVGYSITSGKFYGNNENNVVTGAPRDGEFFGRVYIFKTDENGYRMTVYQMINGLQFGEYFGATVLAVNLNNDSYTDLLVAAPLHSPDKDHDAGKVYIFLSNGLYLRMSGELNGKKKVSGRFGTAIANLGDINQDGFNDIAIGAPYEDEGGSIYLYHGAAYGVRTEFTQKITASSIDLSLRGFGIHISRGFDIDYNKYPDVLVGAYASSNAVLFRAQPIIQVYTKISFKPKQINTNVTNCVYQGEKVPCFNVTVCLRYEGKHVPEVLKFENQIHLENPLQGNSNRGFFNKNGTSLSDLEKTTKLKTGTYTCITEEIYIRPNVQDIITPFQVFYSYDLISNETSNNFKKIPVIDPLTSKNFSSSISFLNGCGDDDVCFSDLAVSIKVIDHPENTPLVIGQNSTLSLLVEVQNFGEPAYLTELSIFLPEEAPSKKDICSSEIDSPIQSETFLLCHLENPFLKEKTKKYVIKLDLNKIPVGTKEIYIKAEARTASNETNNHDNSFIFPLNFTSIANVAITGTASQNKISFDEKSTTPEPVFLKHTYFVMNRGPSVLTDVNFTLSIPSSFQKGRSGETFASLVNVETDKGNPSIIPVKCFDLNLVLKSTSTETNVKNEDNTQSLANNSYFDIVNEFKPETSRVTRSIWKKDPNQMNDIRIDCETVKCISIHCSASPFKNKKHFARIAVTIQINIKPLSLFYEHWNKIEFVTNSRRDFDENQVAMESPPEPTQVKTIIVRSPAREEVSQWVIFVSIGVGLLLLILIIVLLIKFGFFRRKQKEKMKEMQMTSDDLDFCQEDQNTEST